MQTENKKSSQEIISSSRDENITALQKESRKSKRRQKQASYFEISGIIRGHFRSFPSRSVVA